MKLRPAHLVYFFLFGLAILLIPAGASVSRASAPLNSRHYVVPTVAPGEWPMYGHDVSRTNFNPDETSISEATVGSLTQGWQQFVGNNGTSSSSAPSISGGRVFVGSSASSGPDFYAFNAVTGGSAWSISLTYTSACFNVGIGSTAAISGTILSVGGGDGAFYGIDTNSGGIIWRNLMNVGTSAFPWESPLLAYDRSYLGIASRCDNPSVRGEVRAADLYNGSTINSQYFVGSGQRGGGIWNSPALSPDGSILVVATGEDYQCSPCTYTRSMVALDPITLAILGWNQQGNASQDADYGTTPVIFHDSRGRTLVGANHKNGIFYTYDITNIGAGPVWSKNTGVQVGYMPAYDPTFGNGGTLFIIGGTSDIWAVDPATGQNRWPQGSVVAGGQGNIAIANGLIFVNAESSGLRIYRESDGTLLRTLTPPNAGSSNSGVAVSNGYIYWVAGSYLNAWTISGTPGPTNTPTVTRTPSNTPTVTRTGTPTNTPVSTFTPTFTNTPTGTLQPSSTPTNTPPVTLTPTPTSGASNTPAPSPTPCTLVFSDVSPSDYFYAAVTYLSCHGAISGYADGTFRPYNNTTRGQLSKIVVIAESMAIQTPTSPTFRDVPEGSTFYPYIETAYSNQLVSGYSCGGPGEPCPGLYFRPNNNVTRAQLTKIVVSAQQWKLLCPPTPTFRDVPFGDPFYCYIETAYQYGIISGYSCGQGCLEFRPGNNATRGQIAKIVYIAITGP